MAPTTRALRLLLLLLLLAGTPAEELRKSGRGNARSSTSSTSVINSKTHNMTLLVRTNGTQTVPSAGVGATKHLRHKNNNHQNRGLQNPCSPEKVQPRTDERRTLLQRRILTERRAHLSRRRRYVQRSSGGVQYRFTPMQNCAGWTYFQPYPIDCGSCIPVSVRVPQSPQAPAHVYNGPAKTWRGPKLGCACHSAGSELTTCDIITGQCRCKQHVIGRNCDSCENGYWGLYTGQGCFKCECDDIGSFDGTCDAQTKQCRCKSGIGGLKCDSCLSGFFGYSNTGCKACEYCIKPGHICDPDTGRCVCPPNTRGEVCEKCLPNSYGHQMGIGCQSCSCDNHGSVRKQCDPATGRCECRNGYTGTHCSECDFGYYGYPRCRKCECSRAGTEPEKCLASGLCSCDKSGQCACKANIVGKRCDECRDGTFGLQLENPAGCTQCFCFGRTAHCTESNLTIGHIRLNTSRELEVEYIFKKQYSPVYKHPFQNYLLHEDNLLVIPGSYDDSISIQVDSPIDQAIYWQLPTEFLGDKILSYGGYLRFVTETVGGSATLPFSKFPLVRIRGNEKIVLEHYQLLPSPGGRHEIRLHESLWRWSDRPHVPVPRDILMVALQNIQQILIRANSATDFSKVMLHNVTLDTAIMLMGSPPPLAKGVELCECPRQYNSSSCQNPSIGFYRWYNPSPVNGTIIINLIGEAKPCQCNGRSNVCDTESGHCLSCTENTTGSNCQYCAEGFHGNPLHGKCKPCPCPSKDRNFSRKCHRLHHGGFKCICKTGYSGPKCDSCKSGYFGNPEEEGGSCRPCNCNKYGSASDECDQKTGQCNCRPGMLGKDCSLCENSRHALQFNGCKPCDNCTQWLLDHLGNMSEDLDRIYNEYVLYDQVRQLYDKLNTMSNRTKIIRNDLIDYTELQDEIKQYSLKTITQSLDFATRLKNNEIRNQSDKIATQVADINKDINDLYSNIDEITKQIIKTLNDLQNFGTSHIEVKNAVKTGKKIMDEIKAIPSKEIDLLEKKIYCANVFNEVKEIDTTYNIDINELKLDLDDFKRRLKDMLKIVSANINTITEAEKINMEVSDRLHAIQNRLNELNNINFVSLKEATVLLNKAKEFYKTAASAHNSLEDSTQFEDLFKQMENGNYIYNNVSIPYLTELVHGAKRYAEHLKNLADNYRKSFNISHETDLALKASRGYQEIIDLLKDARHTAQEASDTIDEANKEINPQGISLIDETLDVVDESDAVIEEAKILQSRVEDLNEHKELLNISISDGQNILWRTGLKDNQLNSNIHNLTLNKKDMLSVIHAANAISNKMKDIYKNATSIKEDIQYKLRPELDKLQKSGVEIVSLGEEKLSVAERNIKTSIDILISLESNKHLTMPNIRKWNDTVTRKLDELKSRILKAKQAADGIRVSLTNAKNAVCARSYKPYNFGPTTTSTIGLTLSLNNTDKNSSLFYLQTTSKDFMALQLVNKHIQYLWNLGGDTGQLKIKLPRDLPHDGWYKIDVERIANVAKLTVFTKDIKDKPLEVRGATSSDFTRFDSGPNDKVWIGGSLINNDHLQTNQLSTETGIAGCLSDVFFDGKPIGLWNFVNSTDPKSCSGCTKNSVDSTKSDNCCYFNGRGYSVMPRDTYSIYKPAETSIRFDFRTYDENALLFLAIDVINKKFVSISMKNGRVQFHIEYGGKSVLILTSENKYNTGERCSVSASRVYQRTRGGERAVLEVNTETISGKPMNMPEKNAFPNLTNAKYYVGGVPPEFYIESNEITKTLHTHASFLGCMEEIHIDRSRYNPLDEKHYERYGVEPSCSNKPFKVAGFEGAGYIEMPEQTLSSGSSFAFIFRSKQKEAILLEAINPDQIDNYYKVSLASGKLEVNIKMGKKMVELYSNTTVNDGHYHVVFVKILKRTLKLRIDDELHDDKPIDSKNLNIRTSIFLGGLPESLSNIFHIPPTENLTGTIKDYIVNDRLILFNDLVHFEKVKIGRAGPLPDVTVQSEVSTLMMPGRKPTIVEQPQCHRIPSYSLEAGAVKFGDASNSYVQHVFKSHNFWNKDFTIELEFRTFYLNGLIFVSPGIKEKNRHYVMLTLKDYSISLIVKGKRKKEVIIPQKYDDGLWHNVMIQNLKKKLTVTIDGQSVQGKMIKRLNVANMIYIGGVPANGSHLPDAFLNKLHPFRGCVRNLKVNHQSQDLIRDTGYHNNVGQCFPHVEIGSYFAGDAFAIYKKNFVVNTQLELQFEFRTSEQNGILLSITDPFNNHGLSLELYNGAVVMMGNMGSNGPTKVKTNLSTEYSLCDNKWHKVSALFSKEEMTVNVDGVVISSLAINSLFMESKIESALYIGGLPDDEPMGTLHTKENFKGCIRNVVIEHVIIDWTDMDELQNILLNSCPVTHS